MLQGRKILPAGAGAFCDCVVGGECREGERQE